MRFLRQHPWVLYQLLPVLVAGLLILTYLCLFDKPKEDNGSWMFSAFWIVSYALFKLTAPTLVRFSRVIWASALFCVVLIVLFFPYWFGIAFATGKLNDRIIWHVGLLLLLLEYIWPFPPAPEKPES